tara:strand:+ start:469 stop:579 length:111 start_codon:yes stop_codon:yes gene_type:complete
MIILETAYYAFMIMVGCIFGTYITPIIANEIMMVIN